jgi:DNA-binding MarR family transcriptional regulator
MASPRECASMLLQTLHPLVRTMRDATRQIKLDRSDTPTMEQFRLMQVLAARPRNLRELAAKHAVSASTMSRSIDVVVQRGWVTRTADPADRRQVVIALSPEGEALHAAMVREVEVHLTERLAGLDEAERVQLHAALAVIGRLLAASSPADHAEDCDAPPNQTRREMEHRV